MILAVLAFLQTIVSVTVPGYLMLQGMQERIALPVEIHVPPHEENYQVVVEVIAGDVEHVSRWLVKGGKERWLIRWHITYMVGAGVYEVKVIVLRKDGTIRGYMDGKGEVIR